MESNKNKAYIGLPAHILLLLFTCGIWNLIWTYRVTDYLNEDKTHTPRSSVNQLLLCLFVPFYYIYWTYESALRTDALSKQIGHNDDSAVLCVILAIFVPFIPPIIIQNKINNYLTDLGSGASDSYVKTTDPEINEAKKYCPVCGEKLEADDLFCQNCGAKQ